MPSTIDQLKALLGSNNVLTGEDANRAPAGIVKPGEQRHEQVIVRPSSTEEISEVLKICHAAGQSVVPQGGMTGLVKGAEIIDDEIALSLERMNVIEEVDTINCTMTVQAGVVLQVIQEQAEQSDLFFPMDLGARGSATIGGNVSTNAGGNRVIRYGMTRALVLGLEVVLADGTVVSSMGKVIKDNSGYDLKQLFIGAEGTLGIVTRVVLKLSPLPTTQDMAFVAFKDFREMADFLTYAKQALAGNLSAFEVLWRDYYQFLTGDDMAHRQWLGYDFPYYALIESTGSHADTDHDQFVDALAVALDKKLICDAVITKSQGERNALWAMRDDVQSLIKLWPLTGYDISLPIDKMENCIEELEQALQQHWPDSTCMALGHLGDGNLHIVATLQSEESAERDAVDSIVYNLIKKYGGSISAEHGVGLQKKPYLSCCRSESELALMKTIRLALDPKGILNPGKLF